MQEGLHLDTSILTELKIGQPCLGERAAAPLMNSSKIILILLQILIQLESTNSNTNCQFIHATCIYFLYSSPFPSLVLLHSSFANPLYLYLSPSVVYIQSSAEAVLQVFFVRLHKDCRVLLRELSFLSLNPPRVLCQGYCLSCVVFTFLESITACKHLAPNNLICSI